MISRFIVKNLYGERDVDIKFDSSIKILVAENGYGKTTILNALYYVTTGNLRGLRKIEFDSIELYSYNGDRVEISRDEIVAPPNKSKDHGFYSHLCAMLGAESADELVALYFDLEVKQLKQSPIFKRALNRTGFNEDSLLDYLDKFIGSPGGALNPKLRKKIEKARSYFPKSILYLPTYRRVEIDLGVNLQKQDGNLSSPAINFGMRDVEELIKGITQEILTSSVEWFSKVNGQMLSQLVEGFTLDEESRDSIRNPEAIKIVLDRIGNNIDPETKQQILQLIDTGNIFNNHDPLIYFIANLVKVYEQQKQNDRAIQAFTDVCNRYLGDKRIKYNESSVSVEVVRRKNGKPVLLETLSSGEKQIISLFAKLYLQKQENIAIFFDEPELSLSMEWQKTLLPDILDSNKCAFLFCTTHSPFIFQNELKKNTVDLAKYIKEL